ncbi:sigma-54-dependent Fis family transcriptional regulator [Zobellella maritima]|uniref:sigma-54-dependent Fis family transcriptional regulator n=1 Tax=Zobellella maritima TaxID=2059725 RepID=UPI000E3084A3|nr:sigma-54-dependent Fis family transcriptional regulator [Zobellella maritima]
MKHKDDEIARLLGERLGPGKPLTDPAILGSWRRCMEQYHLDPHARHQSPRLSESELNLLREPFAELLHLAVPVFDRLRRTAVEAGYSLLLTDAQGVVVQSYLDSGLSRELADKGMAVGSVWSEQLVGTNGLGTCLATGLPMTVYAGEHFDQALLPFSCSTAPLFSADGSLLGAIDISTYAQGSKAMQQLALNLVQGAAEELEALLFRQSHRQHLLVTLAQGTALPRPAETALLALDQRGHVQGLTGSLLRLLSLRYREEVLHRPVSQVLGVPFEQLLAASRERPCRLGALPWYAWPLPGLPGLTQTTRSPASLPGEVNPLQRAAGEDPCLQRQADICQKMVDRGISILIQGETGTGKEVWARALHDSSQRRHKPFVTLNCAAIPETLIESELFGYGSGAFTGALKGGKMGKIQASAGGTLFLDEIGDMPLALQSRLLRVLAEQEVTPVGQINPVPVQLSVICATHRALPALVEQGEFREDLYYRISGLKVILPPLRTRQDKPGLIRCLLSELTDGQMAPALTAEAEVWLRDYTWPGNIRQLKSALQFALALAEGGPICPEHLPEEVYTASRLTSAEPAVRHHDRSDQAPPTSANLEQRQQQQERDYLKSTLDSHAWVITSAARALGISRATLHRKINKYGLVSPNKGNR